MVSLTPPLEYLPCQIEIFHENTEASFKIIPKGRRFGFTKGAAHACMEWMSEGIYPLLWTDTINGNIDRYFDRYFRPVLKLIPKKYWNWNQQKKIFTLGDAYMDFRSADVPQSIEGFGYKKIILNEAGIILKDDYLYSNAILPMLMDYPESQLIAGGVPKGKFKRDGTKHKFFELWEKVVAGEPGFWGKQYSSYDNPLLTKESIQQIFDEISPAESDQEIFAKFTETEGTNPFAHQFRKEKHESEVAKLDRNKPLIISIDFNINPFAITFHHIWRDTIGDHHHVVQEQAIDNGSIPAMIDFIKTNFGYWLPSCTMTGDASGDKREISQVDLASLFTQLQRGLNLRTSQIVIPPNPTHFISRNDVNYVLLHHPDFKINPATCPETVKDMKRVQWDSLMNKIIKADRSSAAQRADFLDTIRSSIHTFHHDWVLRHQKTGK